MCATAVPIILGVVSAGLGVAGAVAANQEAQRQVAFQNMVAEQQFQYQQLQVQNARTTEDQRERMRDEEIQRNTELAQITRANQIAQINTRQMQEREAAAQKKQITGKRALQAAGQIRARGQIGNNVDLLLADVRRQQAAFDFYTDRNLAFVNMELQARKKIADGEYANRVANQTPYMKQNILDAYQPAKHPAPSSMPYILQGAGAIVGGINTGISTYAAMKDAGLIGKSAGASAVPTSLYGGSGAASTLSSNAYNYYDTGLKASSFSAPLGSYF